MGLDKTNPDLFSDWLVNWIIGEGMDTIKGINLFKSILRYWYED